MEKLSKRYLTSTNYDLLFELMQDQRVVCFVNYKDYKKGEDGYILQDICQTQAVKRDTMFEISARGYSYISAFDKEEFIEQCKTSCLEFIEPNI